MSNSPFLYIDEIDTENIHECISHTLDITKLDKELVIRYNKFPVKLPCLETKLREIFKMYYANLGSEGYRYNIKGEMEYELFLVITPPWTVKSWTKGIKHTSSNITNTINMHIFLNNSETMFSYFCPFKNDVISLPSHKNTLVVYPDFWGSLFKHCSTFDSSTVYLRCVMGLSQ
jgi:hypothetical protein